MIVVVVLALLPLLSLSTPTQLNYCSKETIQQSRQFTSKCIKQDSLTTIKNIRDSFTCIQQQVDGEEVDDIYSYIINMVRYLKPKDAELKIRKLSSKIASKISSNSLQKRNTIIIQKSLLFSIIYLNSITLFARITRGISLFDISICGAVISLSALLELIQMNQIAASVVLTAISFGTVFQVDYDFGE